MPEVHKGGAGRESTYVCVVFTRTMGHERVNSDAVCACAGLGLVFFHSEVKLLREKRSGLSFSIEIKLPTGIGDLVRLACHCQLRSN